MWIRIRISRVIGRVNLAVYYRRLVHRPIHLILRLAGNLGILALYLRLCLRQGLLGRNQLLVGGNQVLLSGTERTVHGIYLVL